MPLLDASTRRLLLSAAMPIRSASESGAVEGVTGIDIDILDILNGIQSRVRIGGDAESHIIQLVGDDGTPYRRGESGQARIRRGSRRARTRTPAPRGMQRSSRPELDADKGVST